jgi:putative PIN family toxin of toxin-antitoxin system
MVLDTNVLVSALITPGGLPDKLLQHWEADDFTLVTCTVQLNELQRVLTYDKLQRFIRPEQAARLIESIRSFAVLSEKLPDLNVSSDATDNLILATAVAGTASHLITGDKGDLLNLRSVDDIAIITVRDAIQLLAARSGGAEGGEQGDESEEQRAKS